MSLDNIGLDQLKKFISLKHTLLQAGDLIGLLELKKQCPGLFIDSEQKEISKLFDDIRSISPFLNEKRKLEEQKKWFAVDIQEWKLGVLDDALQHYHHLKYKQIHVISRLLVKESIAGCLAVCSAEISDIFPFLSLLLIEILLHFPEDQHDKMIERIFFKISGHPEFIPALSAKGRQWQKQIRFDSHYAAIRECMKENIIKILVKFDARKGFYSDLLFFLLIETAAFIGLMTSNIGRGSEESQQEVIEKLAHLFTYVRTL